MALLINENGQAWIVLFGADVGPTRIQHRYHIGVASPHLTTAGIVIHRQNDRQIVFTYRCDGRDYPLVEEVSILKYELIERLEPPAKSGTYVWSSFKGCWEPRRRNRCYWDDEIIIRVSKGKVFFVQRGRLEGISLHS